MERLTGKAGARMSKDHGSRLDRHEVAIEQLGHNFTKLQGEMHTGFANITSGFSGVRGEFSDVKNTLTALATKFDARPQINVHETIRTVGTIVLLVGAGVSAVIWIASSQFSGIIAEQKVTNAHHAARLDKHEERLDQYGRRITETEAAIGRWTTQTARAR